ncbi:hypothetical protein SAY86_030510 [Trapa natans]|uniref:BHLH domain-containing protein n=1 Tax=Trapa natans TaxID=22666 RepID=A0AAN7RAP3_TRANT|nr:hypothetical protein SAY86_030510 [Trapa natans]
MYSPCLSKTVSSPMRKSAKRSNCFSSSPMGKWTRSRRLGKRMVRGRSRQVVSEKLESLRNLIPSGGKGIATLPATLRLLQETADYIIRSGGHTAGAGPPLRPPPLFCCWIGMLRRKLAYQ